MLILNLRRLSARLLDRQLLLLLDPLRLLRLLQGLFTSRFSSSLRLSLLQGLLTHSSDLLLSLLLRNSGCRLLLFAYALGLLNRLSSHRLRNRSCDGRLHMLGI